MMLKNYVLTPKHIIIIVKMYSYMYVHIICDSDIRHVTVILKVR